MFKLGDRVIVTKKYDSVKVGTIGVVLLTQRGNGVGIHFNEQPFRGHNLRNLCPDNRGYWINVYYLKLLIDKDKIAPIKVPREKLLNLTF